jgi:hypothetical protein
MPYVFGAPLYMPYVFGALLYMPYVVFGALLHMPHVHGAILTTLLKALTYHQCVHFLFNVVRGVYDGIFNKRRNVT